MICHIAVKHIHIVLFSWTCIEDIISQFWIITHKHFNTIYVKNIFHNILGYIIILYYFGHALLYVLTIHIFPCFFLHFSKPRATGTT